jgi:hypothetical protein
MKPTVNPSNELVALGERIGVCFLFLPKEIPFFDRLLRIINVETIASDELLEPLASPALGSPEWHSTVGKETIRSKLRNS